MGFKKIILQLPEEGYTGTTVKHIVTETNLKNNPELNVRGVKVGDEIDVIPEDSTKPAATKGATKPVKPVVAKEPKEPKQPEPKVKTGEARAKEIAQRLNVELVIENLETGEFFTSKNLAQLSVGNDLTKLKNHNF